MKRLIWLLFLMASCTTIVTNRLTSAKQVADHFIQITMVNAADGALSLVGALQRNGVNLKIEYSTAGSVNQPATNLSFTCYHITEDSLLRLKTAIGRYSGVIAVNDTILN